MKSKSNPTKNRFIDQVVDNIQLKKKVLKKLVILNKIQPITGLSLNKESTRTRNCARSFFNKNKSPSLKTKK